MQWRKWIFLYRCKSGWALIGWVPAISVSILHERRSKTILAYFFDNDSTKAMADENEWSLSCILPLQMKAIQQVLCMLWKTSSRGLECDIRIITENQNTCTGKWRWKKVAQPKFVIRRCPGFSGMVIGILRIQAMDRNYTGILVSEDLNCMHDRRTRYLPLEDWQLSPKNSVTPTSYW